ncbi:hypothetical protein DsansV1_C21g0167511 [Dioscorea sansibarensis]
MMMTGRSGSEQAWRPGAAGPHFVRPERERDTSIGKKMPSKLGVNFKKCHCYGQRDVGRASFQKKLWTEVEPSPPSI